MNKKTIKDFKKIKKERIKDEEEFRGFQISNLLGGIADGLFVIIILVLDGYIVITEKVEWTIVVLITLFILILYFLIKRYYKNETQSKRSSKK
jgi:membrane protein DedA with SNARE-associated domain